MRLLLGLGIVFGLFGALLSYFGSGVSSAAPLRTVRTVSASSLRSSSLADSLLTQFSSVPVLVKDSFVTQWPARSVLVNPDFWSEQVGPFDRVALSRSGVFCFFKADRPWSNVSSVRAAEKTRESAAPKVRNDVPVEEFFELLLAENDGKHQHVAWSEVVHRIKTKDAAAREFLMPLFPNVSSLLVNGTTEAILRLWFASAGSRTLAHHDYSHNFYVVLEGMKRFVLYPPSLAPHLYFWPFVHPNSTKSQVDVLSNLDALDARFARFKRHAAGHGAEAIVEAGDVLYIPPFWLHDVTTLAPTASVSVWSPSRDDKLFEQLVALHIPVLRKDDDAAKQHKTFLWTAVLLDAAFGGANQTCEFVSVDLLDGRFVQFRDGEFAANDSYHCVARDSRKARLSRAREVLDGKVLNDALDLVVDMNSDFTRIILANYVEVTFVNVFGPSFLTSALRCFKQFTC